MEHERLLRELEKMLSLDNPNKSYRRRGAAVEEALTNVLTRLTAETKRADEAESRLSQAIERAQRWEEIMWHRDCEQCDRVVNEARKNI